MHIISLNAWGGTLHGPLLSFLAEARPAVLCLQEVIHSPETTKADLTYRDSERVLPQRANLFTEIQSVLSEYQAMFCPAARGTLWDGEVAVASFWGQASFVHRSLPITAQAQGFVHKTYGADGYGAHPRSRPGHAMRLFDHAAGRGVCVTHMHGLRDPAGKHDTPARRAQALRFLELLSLIHISEPTRPY